MRFFTRAIIAILAGIGAGLVGFGVVWHTVSTLTNEHPGLRHDAWLLAGIFGPGILVPLCVFHTLSRAAVQPKLSN
jgi:hypothetical protein